MALTSLVTSLRIGTFLTSGNPRLSMAVINVHGTPPTVSRVTMAVINIQAAPPTVSRVSQIHVDTWVSLDQAFYAQGLFGGGEVFAPDFFVEPIFESPAAPEIEVNPYRAAEPNTDLQQILREQHNVTQAGDSTFHWGVLTDIYNEPLYNLGSLGKFYHDDLGIIHARYCRFVDFNLTDAKATPVGLKKPGNLPWTVTNQLSLSHADAVIGIALPYDNKVNIGTWYGWVVTEGFLPAEVPVTISNKKFLFGTEYGWSANGNIAQELDSVSVGYRVRIDNDPRMQPGAFYVQTDRSSLGRANGLITTRLAPLVSDIEGLDTRLTPLEATVAGHTIAIAAVNKKHDDFAIFMTKEVKNLSDALMAIRALMPDGNFKTYVDTSVAALKGYVDTAITVVGNVANAGLARANEAMQFAQSISYAAIQTQIDALNNAMGGITNRIIGFKTTIDTNTLTAGQVLVSVLDSTDVDGVNYYSFHPVDYQLDSLLDVDMVTTPPVHGDSLVWDGVNGKWVPFAVSGGGGGGGVPEAPTDGKYYSRRNAAWAVRPLALTQLWTWNGAVDAAFMAHDVDVTGYDELLVIQVGTVLSASQWRTLQFSSDGGATFDTTAGNYLAISASGTAAVAGDVNLYMHASSSATAKTVMTQLQNLSKAAPTVFGNTRENSFGLHLPEVVVNRVRITTVSGTANYTAGKIWVYGR